MDWRGFTFTCLIGFFCGVPVAYNYFLLVGWGRDANDAGWRGNRNGRRKRPLPAILVAIHKRLKVTDESKWKGQEVGNVAGGGAPAILCKHGDEGCSICKCKVKARLDFHNRHIQDSRPNACHARTPQIRLHSSSSSCR